MTLMQETRINGRWSLQLPEHRAARPQWKIENGGWEKERISSMYANLLPRDLIFDIGAEEGDMPALWASWGCRVALVEPNPRVWPNIRAIWNANDLAPPVGWFVGFSGPEVRDVAEWSGNRVAHDGWPTCSHGDVIGDHGFLNLCERPDCPSTTIDVMTAKYGPPDAITMDVEGAELQVLMGAGVTLHSHRPLVWVSIHEEFIRQMYNQTRQDVIDFMATHGYRMETLAVDHEEHALFWHPEGRWPDRV